ncbi:putative packaging maturation protein B [Ralstonia phage phiITL-1]|uniref:Terminase, large subunit n=1 Tax=Ralstonia phage phiITL-1 TaxID=1597967 RepID=A0A0U1ZDM1_9CAUD|nr:terminase large subunit [Ralstonia phage phiITL-1]AJT60797.1 putative packaging maturation protein B [Ralstonia phage phiITL-1]
MSIEQLKTDTKEALLQKRMRDDFRVFVWFVWKVINLPNPTDIQNDMAWTLQNPPSRRFILQGFRGVAKSFITCAYVVWRLWRDPQLKIMIVSASKERADANSQFIKKIISEIEFLHHLKAAPGQVDTVVKFDVGPKLPDHSPSVKSVGITGQLTGSRADIIIADDVEVPGNSSTQGARDKLFELVKEFDAILKPGGTVIYLGTPQNEMSLYNELLNRGYVTLIWPARYPRDEKQRANYGTRLAPYLAERYDADPEGLSWKPTDPQRFDENDLLEREVSYGKAGFALQFMLDTSLSDAEKYPLRLRDMIVGLFPKERAPMSHDWLPGPPLELGNLPQIGLKGDRYYGPYGSSKEMSNYFGKVMAIDPSGRGKDETGYAVMYFLNGYLYLMEVGGFRGGYEDATLESLAKVAKKWAVNDVIIEGNFGDGMYLKLFTPVVHRLHKCNVEEVRSVGQKEVRIADTLEPIFGAHRFCVSESAIEHDYATAKDVDGKFDPKYSCFYQMSRLTRERGALAHDDRLDAVAMAAAFFVERMDLDAAKQIAEATEEFLAAHMEDPLRTGESLTRYIEGGSGLVILSTEDPEDSYWDDLNMLA